MAVIAESSRTHEPVLVLGTAQLRMAYGITRRSTGAPSADDARRLLTAAAELGVAALDTAPGYGDAEDAIGRSGTTLPVHTKVDPARTPSDSLARSLGRLRRERVEVLYLHDSAEVLRDPSPVVSAAHELVGDLVGRLGASVYDVEEFDAAVRDPRIQVVQVPLNVLDRRIDADRLEAAAKQGVHVYGRSILLQGVLAAPPGAVEGLAPHVVGFQALARELGRTPVELALGWVRALPGVQGVVMGAESVADLREIVDAWSAPRLDPEALAAVGALPLPPPELCDPRRWQAVTT